MHYFSDFLQASNVEQVLTLISVSISLKWDWFSIHQHPESTCLGTQATMKENEGKYIWIISSNNAKLLHTAD